MAADNEIYNPETGDIQLKTDGPEAQVYAKSAMLDQETGAIDMKPNEIDVDLTDLNNAVASANTLRGLDLKDHREETLSPDRIHVELDDGRHEAFLAEMAEMGKSDIEKALEARAEPAAPTAEATLAKLDAADVEVVTAEASTQKGFNIELLQPESEPKMEAAMAEMKQNNPELTEAMAQVNAPSLGDDESRAPTNTPDAREQSTSIER